MQGNLERPPKQETIVRAAFHVQRAGEQGRKEQEKEHEKEEAEQEQELAAAAEQVAAT